MAVYRNHLPHQPVEAIALLPDGNRFVYSTKSGSTHLVDSFSGKELRTLESEGVEPSLRVSKDGGTLAIATRDRLSVWNMRTFEQIDSLRHTPSPQTRVYLSDDGRSIALAYQNGNLAVRTNRNSAFKEFRAHRNWITGVVFLPASNQLITSGADSHLKLWNLDTGEQRTIGRSLNAMTSPTLIDSGTRLATGSGEGVLRIWSLETHQQLLSLSSPSPLIQQVGFSADGNTLVSASIGGGDSDAIRIWRAPSWNQIAQQNN